MKCCSVHVAHEIYSYYPMRTLRERRYKLIWNMTWQAEFPLPVDTFNRRLWKSIRETKATTICPRTVEQFLHRPKFELYDIEADPWELHNLATDPQTSRTPQEHDRPTAEATSRNRRSLAEQVSPGVVKRSELAGTFLPWRADCC